MLLIRVPTIIRSDGSISYTCARKKGKENHATVATFVLSYKETIGQFVIDGEKKSDKVKIETPSWHLHSAFGVSVNARLVSADDRNPRRRWHSDKSDDHRRGRITRSPVCLYFSFSFFPKLVHILIANIM